MYTFFRIPWTGAWEKITTNLKAQQGIYRFGFVHFLRGDISSVENEDPRIYHALFEGLHKLCYSYFLEGNLKRHYPITKIFCAHLF